LSKLCYIYREIDRIRKLMFDFTLSKVKRDYNSVAHELAKRCRVEGTVGIWFDYVPTQISPFVLNDCNLLMNE
jgi:hypothetical protein